ncbi:DUF4381 domain-containing protein [Thiomicrospira sp. ALE5]|uniref:DUF4381 domain-containing protein n=1 Tax=Thiomicrospira sp. ALE5 TaxID=748650 RepID=UPI0008E55340|nr:DUF4381 domain-containing protein [Thiomicrospira sp. ALE5]SFR56709.1 protein of unknown function [Thiomicrospira sp. ALE5]
MNLNQPEHFENPLAQQLHDIILPDPISWWPLAGSVWAMLIIILGIIIGLIVYFWHRYQQHSYRRTALRDIQKLIEYDDDLQLMQQLNAKLKQVAITTYGRHQVASLTDQAWLNFLHDKAQFIPQPNNIGQLVQYYAKENKLSAAERQRLIDYAQQWIKEHHL